MSRFVGRDLDVAYACGPGSPPERDLTVGAALREAADLYAGRPALSEGVVGPAIPREWSYAGLLRDAEALAATLVDRYPAGSRIAIWAPNVVQYQLVQYATALAGMVLVTVNPAFRVKEAGYVLGQSEATAVFAVREFRGRHPLDLALGLRDTSPALRDVFDIEDAAAYGRPADGSGLPVVDPSAPAMILYSSGTTGTPKGAVLTHRGITNNAREAAIRVTAGHLEGVVWLATLPMFHLGGCVVAGVGTLMLGGTLVPMRAFEASTALRLIEERGVTVTNLVPTMLHAIFSDPGFSVARMGSLRSIMLGGTTVPADLAQRVLDLGTEVVVAYGQTEAAMASATKPGDPAEDLVNSCGTALPHVEVRICDPVTALPVARGVVGELQVRGSLTLKEYFRDPEATAAVLGADGWLRTGDLARMDARGYLYVVGRAKDMIIRGGENIYPREIEDLLTVQPGVADAAVVGVPDDYYGEVAVAFVRPAPGAALDAAGLRSALAGELSGYKIPAYWVFVDSFPQTASGKIRKVDLRESWLSGGFTPESAP